MRIALVVSGGMDPSGREAVIPALLALVERIARRHDVVVYVLRYFDEPRRYSLRGATIQDLGRPRGVRQQYAALIRAVRRDGPFSLIHAYWALPPGLVAACVARRVGLPSIVTLDSGEFAAIPDIGYGQQLRARQRAAVWATCRLATSLTVCSQFQKRLAHLAEKRVTVIPLGVDASLFKPSTRREGPPWRLIHVANLNPVKDQATLLNAFRDVVNRVGDVYLDIVGLDTLNGAVQRLAEELDISSRISFHGFKASDTLVALYQRAHLAVLTSRHEAAGVATIEAAACGVPTVGTNVGYVADLAPHAAIAAPPGNPSSLADAIVGMLLDRRARERTAESARDWALAHDADWTAEEFDRLYHAVAAD